MEKQMISVGKILKTHGIKGELKVLPLTDDPDKRFQPGSTFYIKTNEEKLTEYTIEKSKPYKKNTILLKFLNVDSIDDAENLSGTYLTIPEKEIAPLEEGRFYIFQIVGLRVYEENGEYLGKIIEVQQTGSNDVYIIKKDSGKELLIPALKEVVKKVDLDNKTMIVHLLPGLR